MSNITYKINEYSSINLMKIFSDFCKDIFFKIKLIIMKIWIRGILLLYAVVLNINVIYAQKFHTGYGEAEFSPNSGMNQDLTESYNNVTNISFEIREPGEARLDILNSKGDLIENLVRGAMEPGHYNVYFKTETGMDNDLYYYELKSKGSSVIRQRIDIKLK